MEISIDDIPDNKMVIMKKIPLLHIMILVKRLFLKVGKKNLIIKTSVSDKTNINLSFKFLYFNRKNFNEIIDEF